MSPFFRIAFVYIHLRFVSWLNFYSVAAFCSLVWLFSNLIDFFLDSLLAACTSITSVTLVMSCSLLSLSHTAIGSVMHSKRTYQMAWSKMKSSLWCPKSQVAACGFSLLTNTSTNSPCSCLVGEKCVSHMEYSSVV